MHGRAVPYKPPATWNLFGAVINVSRSMKYLSIMDIKLFYEHHDMSNSLI